MNSIFDLDSITIKQILQKSSEINLFDDYLKDNRIFGLLFFEPSTRTSLSFESAIHKLGGKVIKLDYNFSSKNKGESDYDTVKTIEKYVDVLIIRHPIKGFISTCKSFIQKPIINAGDGDGEHPTQALLDLFTIQKYFNNVTDEAPLKIGFAGDIRYSRTIHSLVYLLEKINKNIHYTFISIPELMPQTDDEFKQYMNTEMFYKYKNCYSTDVEDVKNTLNDLDILYMTRIQKERMDSIPEISDHILKLSEDLLKDTKDTLIVMHPLPRNDEIPESLDTNPKCKYFDQVENGVCVRMAILYLT